MKIPVQLRINRANLRYFSHNDILEQLQGHTKDALAGIAVVSPTSGLVKSNDYVLISEGTLSFAMPSEHSLAAAEISACEAEITRLRADTENEITKLRERINSLLALPMEKS